jgi:hypothetical protein
MPERLKTRKETIMSRHKDGLMILVAVIDHWVNVLVSAQTSTSCYSQVRLMDTGPPHCAGRVVTWYLDEVENGRKDSEI